MNLLAYIKAAFVGLLLTAMVLEFVVLSVQIARMVIS